VNYLSYLFDPAHWTGSQGIPAEIVTGIVLVLLLALIFDGLLLLLGRAITPWDRVGRTAGRPT